MSKLTLKQESFCRLIVAGENQSGAYRGAYNAEQMMAETIAKKACGLMKQGNIRGRVAELSKPALDKLEITTEYILETIVDTIKRCRQARPVTDKQGKPIIVTTPGGDIAAAYVFDASGAFKGADMLMKFKGLYEADKVRNLKHEHTMEDEMMARIFESLPDTTGLPSERDK